MTSKTAIVTGSSRGIGRTIAKKLALSGYDVVINYLNSEAEAKKLQMEIETKGGRAIAVKADVSSSDEAQYLIEKTVSTYGFIDVLVNNAGINHNQLALKISDEQWRKIISTNLDAAFYCSRAALRFMTRQKSGRIINISSVVGLTGNAGQAHYSAAKAGLIGLTKSLAKEYGKRGITVNAVAPGFIETDMTDDLSAEQKKKIVDGLAVNRIGKPEDVAELVNFLASDEALYITGQVIQIDGGLSSL